MEMTCDYVIVGSGAGGGTLAARLAEAGMRVVVLEAGGDPRDGPGLPEDYDIPAFHPLASEHPAMRWDFFVRHYADEERQRRDNKLQPEGILYPRAGTLGGCTVHNAMILMAPHDADWDYIATLTGDPSWRATEMWRYFQQLESCRYRPAWHAVSRLGLDQTGHGWDGWLPSERAMPWQVIEDRHLLATVTESAFGALHGSSRPVRILRRLLQSRLDPNDWRLLRRNADGLWFTPLSTQRHQRVGTRERLLAVAARYPDQLRIELHSLATRVVFDDANRACGVEYLKGERLYRRASRRLRQHRRASRHPCPARSGPGGWCVQHAATADALRHRAKRGAGPSRPRGAREASRRRPQPAGPLRDRCGQPHGEVLARAGWRKIRPWGSAVRRMVAASRPACTRRTARRWRCRCGRSPRCPRPTCSAWRCWRNSPGTSPATRASSPSSTTI